MSKQKSGKRIGRSFICLLTVAVLLLSDFPWPAAITTEKVMADTVDASQNGDLSLLRQVIHQTAVPAGYIGIYTMDDLRAIEENAAGNYILMNDIDLSGEDWRPICSSPAFTGELDGNGYSLYNMNHTQTGSASYVYGLMGENRGTIKNLRISGNLSMAENMGITGNAASFVLYNKGTISNCTSSVTMELKDSVITGGIAAQNYGRIEFCRYTGQITNYMVKDSRIGGIVYENCYVGGSVIGTIYGCESTGSICVLSGNLWDGTVVSSLNSTCTLHVGGVAGKMAYDTLMEQCRSSAVISYEGSCYDATLRIGGLTGVATPGQEEHKDCCFNGQIKINVDIEHPNTTNYYVGGLIGDGEMEGYLHNCYVSGTLDDVSPTLGGTPFWIASRKANWENVIFPAGSFEPYKWNDTGLEEGYSAISLAAMGDASVFSGFDFTNVWIMGTSWPVQRVFTTLYPPDSGSGTVTPTPTPDPEEPEPWDDPDADDFIYEHLMFAESDEYSERISYRFAQQVEAAMDSGAQNAGEAAYDILNTISEATRFKKLSIFDNPYEAILTEMIMDATGENQSRFSVERKNEYLEIADNLWDAVELRDYTYEEQEFKLGLVTLFEDPETLKSEDPDLWYAIADVLESYVSDESAVKILKTIDKTSGYWGKANDLVAVIEDFDSVIDWIISVGNYAATVKAYHSMSQEYIDVFREIEPTIYEELSAKEAALYGAALDDIDGWMTEENIALAIFKEGLEGFAEVTWDILHPLTKIVMKDFVVTGLGVSTEIANPLFAAIEAYNIGWCISNTITGNDKVAACVDILHANYYIEQAVFWIMEENRDTLISEESYDAAKRFDASWMLLRISEKLSLTKYKELLDAKEDSYVGQLLHLGRDDFNGTEKTLANYEFIRWDAAICHGAWLYNILINEVQVNCAGINYLDIYNSYGDLMVSVVGENVFVYTSGVTANIRPGGIDLMFANENGVELYIETDGRNDITVVNREYDIYGNSLGEKQLPVLDASESQSYSIQLDPEYDDDGEPTGTSEAVYDENYDRVVQETELFWDVRDRSKFFYNPVYWAAANEITSGMGQDAQGHPLFRPDNGCTRAQAVTFLWRYDGRPEPETSYCPFRDVSNSSPFYKAILWAAEMGITTGVKPTAFAPDQECTRGQIVTFLYRYIGEPEPEYYAAEWIETEDGFEEEYFDPSVVEMDFTDIRETSPFYRAVQWAYYIGVTTGISETSFAPDQKCTRGQIVTFIFRYNDYVEYSYYY